jgi:hypothetical protein
MVKSEYLGKAIPSVVKPSEARRYNYLVTVPVTFSVVDVTPMSAICQAIARVDTELLKKGKAHGIVSVKIITKEEETGKLFQLVGDEVREVTKT